MKSEYTIGEAECDDASQIAGVINDAYRGDSDGYRGWTAVSGHLGGNRIDTVGVEALLRSAAGQFLCARQARTVVGCVYVTMLRSHVGEVGLLAIKPGIQQCGLGKALLRTAEQYMANRWGATRAELTVLSPRPELESWYHRRGYQETGQVRSLQSDGEGYGQPLRDDLRLTEFARAL